MFDREYYNSAKVFGGKIRYMLNLTGYSSSITTVCSTSISCTGDSSFVCRHLSLLSQFCVVEYVEYTTVGLC